MFTEVIIKRHFDGFSCQGGKFDYNVSLSYSQRVCYPFHAEKYKVVRNIVRTRRTKSGEATLRSENERFDAGPGLGTRPDCLLGFFVITGRTSLKLISREKLIHD